jgi:hypothetical protein
VAFGPICSRILRSLSMAKSFNSTVITGREADQVIAISSRRTPGDLQPGLPTRRARCP